MHFIADIGFGLWLFVFGVCGILGTVFSIVLMAEWWSR